MKRLLTPDGREHDGYVKLRAEEFGGHIDLAHIDEDARSKLVMRERFSVRLERAVAVHAGRHVSPMRRGQRFARRRFEVEYVDGFGSVGDHALRILCAG